MRGIGEVGRGGCGWEVYQHRGGMWCGCSTSGEYGVGFSGEGGLIAVISRRIVAGNCEIGEGGRVLAAVGSTVKIVDVVLGILHHLLLGSRILGRFLMQQKVNKAKYAYKGTAHLYRRGRSRRGTVFLCFCF